MSFPPFTERAPCVKCGHEFSDFEFQPVAVIMGYVLKEHMRRSCPRCKHSWATATKESSNDKNGDENA